MPTDINVFLSQILGPGFPAAVRRGWGGVIQQFQQLEPIGAIRVVQNYETKPDDQFVKGEYGRVEAYNENRRRVINAVSCAMRLHAGYVSLVASNGSTRLCPVDTSKKKQSAVAIKFVAQSVNER